MRFRFVWFVALLAPLAGAGEAVSHLGQGSVRRPPAVGSFFSRHVLDQSEYKTWSRQLNAASLLEDYKKLLEKPSSWACDEKNDLRNLHREIADKLAGLGNLEYTSSLCSEARVLLKEGVRGGGMAKVDDALHLCPHGALGAAYVMALYHSDHGNYQLAGLYAELVKPEEPGSKGRLAAISAKAAGESRTKFLLDALTSDDPDLRESTLRALRHHTPHRVAELLGIDREGPVSCIVAEWMNEPTLSLADRVFDMPQEADVKRRLQVLRQLNSHAGPVLVAGLLHERETIRNMTARALETWGEDGVAPLIATLGSDEKIRRRAVQALEHIGDKALPQLITALSSEDDWKRSSAAHLIGQLGEKAAPAIPALIKAFDDENQYVRHEIAEALGEIGPSSHTAVPHLMEKLSDESTLVRRSSAWALGVIGEESHASVPLLMEAMRDPSTRYAATTALGRIGEKARRAVPVLRNALSSSDPEWRHRAATALGDIGPAASSAMPRLTIALSDQDGKVRAEAARALAPLKEKASPAVPKLRKLLSDEDPWVRFHAVRTLGEIGEKARYAVPKLRQIAKDEPVPAISNAAIEAVNRITSD